MDAATLEEYRLNRERWYPAASALRQAKSKLKYEFDLKLRGYELRWNHAWDLSRGGAVRLDDMEYEFTVQDDTDWRLADVDCDIRYERGKPTSREHRWGTYVETDDGIYVFNAIAFTELVKYYRADYGRHDAYLRAMQSARGRLEYIKELAEGNAAFCYVRIDYLDEGYGLVDANPEEVEYVLRDMLPG